MFRARTAAAVIVAAVALGACGNDTMPVATSPTSTASASASVEQDQARPASPEAVAWCDSTLDEWTVVDINNVHDGTDAANLLIPTSYIAQEVTGHLRKAGNVPDDLKGMLDRADTAAQTVVDLAYGVIGELDHLDRARPALVDRYATVRAEFNAAVTAVAAHEPGYADCLHALPDLFGEQADLPAASQDLIAACEQFEERVDSLERGTESVADWLRFVDVVPGYLADVLAVARTAVPAGVDAAEWGALINDVEAASDRIFVLFRDALEGADPDDDGDTVLGEAMDSDEWVGPVSEFEALLDRFDEAAEVVCLSS